MKRDSTGRFARKVTDTQEAKICERYMAGDKVKDIAKDMGVNVTSVYAILGRNGVNTNRNLGPAWATEAQKEEICRRYLQGEGSYALAREFGVAGFTVSRLLNQRGIKRRFGSEAHRTHSANHSFFNTIDTEEKAYWLGFLAADGCIVEHAKKAS
jgi:hypothetical protein